MRKLILMNLILILVWGICFGQTNPNHVRVKGYTKSDGTYVPPHYRTAPNSTNRDNFSTRGNTNPYTGKAGWIPPDNKPLINSYSNSTYGIYNSSNSNTSTGYCTHSGCTEQSRKDNTGIYTITTRYCSSHSPKCENPSCSGIAQLTYNGSGYQKYCSDHTHTCKEHNCYNAARADNSGYQKKWTSLCGSHTPRCGNPNCSDYAQLNFYGSGYQKYCSDHAHTCKEHNCYNAARADDSGYQRKWTSLCGSHTPRCGNPNCSDYAQLNFYGSGYQKYCSDHAHTCKEYDCYNIARVDDSGYQRKQTSLCGSHTPRCGNPNCSDYAQLNFYGSGYQKYCSNHAHTCKEHDCYNIARVDDSGYQKKQTSLCGSHTPKCNYPNCYKYSRLNYYGSGYLKYCSEHKE